MGNCTKIKQSKACLLSLDFVIGGMMKRGNSGRADPPTNLGVVPGSRSSDRPVISSKKFVYRSRNDATCGSCGSFRFAVPLAHGLRW